MKKMYLSKKSKKLVSLLVATFLLLSAIPFMGVTVSAQETSTKVYCTSPDIVYYNCGSFPSGDWEAGTAYYNEAAGAYFQYTFFGTGVAWYGVQNTDRSEALVYIDGAYASTVVCNGPYGRTKYYEIKNLSSGVHTIKVVNNATGGVYNDLDYFVIYKDITLPVVTKVDCNAPGITYSSATLPLSDAAWDSSTAYYNAAPGEYFEYTFFGTGIEWYGLMNLDRAQALVYMDGTLASTVECYGTYGRTKYYEIKNLPASTHTIKVVNNATTGTFNELDYFLVYDNYALPELAGAKLVNDGNFNKVEVTFTRPVKYALGMNPYEWSTFGCSSYDPVGTGSFQSEMTMANHNINMAAVNPLTSLDGRTYATKWVFQFDGIGGSFGLTNSKLPVSGGVRFTEFAYGVDTNNDVKYIDDTFGNPLVSNYTVSSGEDIAYIPYTFKPTLFNAKGIVDGKQNKLLVTFNRPVRQAEINPLEWSTFACDVPYPNPADPNSFQKEMGGHWLAPVNGFTGTDGKTYATQYIFAFNGPSFGLSDSKLKTTGVIRFVENVYDVDTDNTIGNLLVDENGDGIFADSSSDAAPDIAYIPYTFNSDVSIDLSYYNLTENSVLTKVATKTTAGSFLGQITTSNTTITLFDKNDSIITNNSNFVGTGCMLKGYYGGTLFDVYTIVVLGDIDGDADITVLDLAKIKSYLLKMDTLSNIQLVAANVNKNSTVSITDLLTVKKHILNISAIVQN